jgi:GDP-L-fucose synthase
MRQRKSNAPVTLWGSGTPMREFLFVDDMAQAVVFALENKLGLFIQWEQGEDLTIKQLARDYQK